MYLTEIFSREEKLTRRKKLSSFASWPEKIKQQLSTKLLELGIYNTAI